MGKCEHILVAEVMDEMRLASVNLLNFRPRFEFFFFAGVYNNLSTLLAELLIFNWDIYKNI